MGKEHKVNITLIPSLFVGIFVLVLFFLFFFNNIFLINLVANKLTYRVMPKGIIPFKSAF